MNIAFAVTSQQGERHNNQDRVGHLLNDRNACFVVCDGVAGLPGGEQAAHIACDTLLDTLAGGAFSIQQSREAVEKSARAIYEAQQINPKLQRMSTTLAALFIDRAQQLAWWAHAGDSRIYHFRRGYLHQVTRDHSLVQRMRDAGYENSGINSNLLYNALGAEAMREASYSEVTTLEDGDAFLVCSDGFWLHLAVPEMEQALRMVNSCQEWLILMQQAIDRARKNDNLSAVAVWVGSPQETTLLQSLADSARLLPPRD
ncbi:PP2C family protein-serine/threonine phosphatase [Mixta tenebrionis]|uniref:Serine/threonine-protein phosphatase n=1 Tax=Mixta tenebrionis TaxID=2562439 RepID=A0A506VFI6_9GAMM|nr:MULTISPECIES: PP2C family serine/threonine-protein phosphatase [Mixta]QHM75697.1 Serine/threonine phosphatase stp [Mixta theicola]TPW44302.1 serine/threonine-protein phosphatase [Mixta tenebrionis]